MSDIANQLRRFTWVTPSGQALPPAGMTVDEVKIHQGKTLQRPEVAPIAQRGPVEFISPTGSSEFLRLAVPEAANPYATPTGPRHDHMMVRQALTRAHLDISGALNNALSRQSIAGVGPEQMNQMRASLSREHAMMSLMYNLQQMQEQIYGRIIGNQNG